MRKQSRPVFGLVVFASLLWATMFLVACNTSDKEIPKAVASEKVYVVFDGPWAFVPDPNDANSVIAVAPKTKGHRDLYVKASNEATLPAGIFDLAVPPRTGPASGTVDNDIYQAKSDVQHVRRALDAKAERYAIRIPKPEAFGVAARHRSRVGEKYPPKDPEKDYAVAAALRYDVSSLNGFSLAGTPDSGTFNPLLLQVETPMIRFVIEPAQDDDPGDLCSTHSREGFRDLTKLLGLTLYVDFQPYEGRDADECHKKDPQLGSMKADAQHTLIFEQIVSFLRGVADESGASNAASSPAGLDGADVLSGTFSDIQTDGRPAFAVAYFFGHPSGDCKAPIISVTTGP